MADPYQGHAPYSAGKLRGTNGENLAPADRGEDFDLANYFETNPNAPGAVAFSNGYPRHDGQPASSGHFGG